MSPNEKIAHFAKEHDIDISTLNMMIEGVNIRVEYYLKNNPGAEITEEIITLAMQHYLHHSKEYYRKLTTDPNEFNSFCKKIEEELNKNA